MLKAAHEFLPSEPMNLVTEAMKDFAPESVQIQKLRQSLSACRIGSIEKRMMRVVIMCCVGGDNARDIIAKDVVNSPGILCIRQNPSRIVNLDGNSDDAWRSVRCSALQSRTDGSGQVISDAYTAGPNKTGSISWIGDSLRRGSIGG